MNSPEIDLNSLKHVHFIGIGGIGISAIARMLLLRGVKVTGSDIAASLVTTELEKAGAKIFIGQTIESVERGADLIVHTSALEKFDEQLLEEIKKRGIPMLTYSQMLGLISKGYYTIAVAGTHGKTTTTAMIAKVLCDAGIDPTVIVGSLLKDSKSNFIAGKSKYLVVEADEYRRQFLSLNPSILVVTNLDADHLDYYKDIEDIKDAFKSLAAKLPKDGYLISSSETVNLADIVKSATTNIVDYAQSEITTKLSVPGIHNIENAKAALAVAKILGIDETQAQKSLADFKGTWRRFEYKGTTKAGAIVYDDYAHNPHKLRAALAGAKLAHPDKKIIAVFQPHLFSRTKALLCEFAESFADADEVMLLPIYAAREQLDASISSEMLLEKIKKNKNNVTLCQSLDAAYDVLSKKYSEEGVIITIGAGDVTTLSDKLIQK